MKNKFISVGCATNSKARIWAHIKNSAPIFFLSFAWKWCVNVKHVQSADEQDKWLRFLHIYFRRRSLEDLSICSMQRPLPETGYLFSEEDKLVRKSAMVDRSNYYFSEIYEYFSLFSYYDLRSIFPIFGLPDSISWIIGSKWNTFGLVSLTGRASA